MRSIFGCRKLERNIFRSQAKESVNLIETQLQKGSYHSTAEVQTMTHPQFCFVYSCDGELPSSEDLEHRVRDHYLNLWHSSKSTQMSPKDTRKQLPKKPVETHSKQYSAMRERYRQTHKQWTPSVNTATMMGAQGDPSVFKSVPPPSEKQAFICYVHTPKLMGEESMPVLSYHTACEVNNKIFCVGGVITLHKEYQPSEIDLSKYKIQGLSMPPPLNSKLLNHPAVIPNDHVYVLSALTDHVSKVEVFGDTPPPLICMSSSQITKRYIFYYGGFEMIDEVDYDEKNDIILIKKHAKLNNSAYVLDTVTMRFTKFELTAHPNKLIHYPITVPRFGHTSTSVNLSRKMDQGLKNLSPATVFIMGGYKETSIPNRFEAIGDLWKVELSMVYEGLDGYIEFGDVVLATPIPVPEGAQTPSARAFHSAELIDSEFVFGQKANEARNFTNPHKLGLARTASPTSVSSNVRLDLRLFAHGGTNGNEIFGDVWYFDFDEELWHEFETFFEFKDHREKVQLKRVGHHNFLIDKFLVSALGAIPLDFPNYLNHTKEGELTDISSLYIDPRRGKSCTYHDDEDRRYYPLFSLHLQTNTWFLYDVYHSYNLPQNNRKDDLTYFGFVGSAVVLGNLRTYVIGGNMIPNPTVKHLDMTQFLVLHSGVSEFEFPLNLSPNDAARIV